MNINNSHIACPTQINRVMLKLHYVLCPGIFLFIHVHIHVSFFWISIKFQKNFKFQAWQGIQKHYKLCQISICRVYWDAKREELQTLKTSWLVDVFEQPMHSKHHYNQALNHILEFCPQLSEYLNKYQLVLTGDFPTWKYNKKLIAEV